MERPDENQFLRNEKSPSSTVRVEDQSSPKTETLFTPKITARISISRRSVVESSTPRFNESPRPAISTFESPRRDSLSALCASSPRSAASPRVTESPLLRTPSPINESSARDVNSPRQPLGSRFIGFFEKMGSKHFSKRRSDGHSPRSLQDSDSANPRTRHLSNADRSMITNESSDAHLSVKQSANKTRSSSFKIQKQKSFIGSSDSITSTEIQYSPRQKSSAEAANSPHLTPVSPESSENKSKCLVLLYCGDEIIVWCRSQGLDYQYSDVKGEFCITLENADVIQIQGHNIHANTLESTTVNKLIDLIKSLPHIENVSIYYVSQGVDIDEFITSRLISSPEENAEVKKLDFN
jgi:hypothetical protein